MILDPSRHRRTAAGFEGVLRRRFIGCSAPDPAFGEGERNRPLVLSFVDDRATSPGDYERPIKSRTVQRGDHHAANTKRGRLRRVRHTSLTARLWLDYLEHQLEGVEHRREFIQLARVAVDLDQA